MDYGSLGLLPVWVLDTKHGEREQKLDGLPESAFLDVEFDKFLPANMDRNGRTVKLEVLHESNRVIH